MDLTIQRDQLQALLASVAGATPVRHTLPVLSHVLLEAEGEALRATATNLDLTVRTEAPADVSAAGQLCVPVATMKALADKLPAGPVHLAVDDETPTEMGVRAGRARMRLSGLPAEEFPFGVLPSEDAEGWRLPAEPLFGAVSSVAFAVSTEETRPIINGILWDLAEGDLRLVATNGHRMGIAQVPTEAPPPAAPEGAGDLIVHPKALLLARALFAGEDEVVVQRTERDVVLRAGRAWVSARTIEGPYPTWRRIVPRDNDKALVADARSLRAAVERLSVLLDASPAVVVLEMAPGEPVRLSTLKSERGGGEEAVGEVEYQGHALRTGFNAAYLSEMLRKLPAERIRWTFSAPMKASILASAGGDAPEDPTQAPLYYLLSPHHID